MDRDELKRRRWRLLPWRIKLVFWLIALPLFVFSCVAWFIPGDYGHVATLSWLASLVVYGFFEALCYSWYNKQGLL
ncbi:hypothetical protein QFW77_03035 [Luteimonas sp. RD2P54]|uniref:Transmembrane protein n=1 Tax=Luteimonas endophytica TaxID=3042023 RepID=A0ABT6J713_9GAMM|nr:hypothetical protein [Luteimonas endophytica]MDH5821968.1 hypothetical protein [Luteimonas endophytica]